MKSKTFARLYDDFYDGEEFHDLTLSAVGLWCRCLSYCNARKTDGNITLNIIRSLTHHNPNTKRTLTELINSGLLLETATGYKFKNWVPFQASRAQIEGKQKYDKNRYQTLKEEKEDLENSETIALNTNTNLNAKSNDITNINTIREEEILKEGEKKDNLSNSNDLGERNFIYSDKDLEYYFNAFYEAYPRKIGYKQARKAFIEAVQMVGIDKIFGGLSNFINDPDRSYEQEFIPYPANWLNNGRWDDEYDYLQEDDEYEEE